MNKILKYFKGRFSCINNHGDGEMMNVTKFSPRVTRSKSKQQQQQHQQCITEVNDSSQKITDDETLKKTRRNEKIKLKKHSKKSRADVNSVRASRGSVGSFSLLHTPKKAENLFRKSTLGALLTPSPKEGIKSPNKSFLLKSPKIGTISADTPERNSHFYKNIENIGDCKLRILGKGSFGTIIQATYKGQLVAAKIVPSQKSNTLQNELNNFLLSHPNIVKTLRIIFNEDNFSYGLVIMEMCSSVNLEHLTQEESYVLNEKSIVSFMTDTSRALSYCHSQKVLHLDVKPKNILVNVTSNTCKLCDFGSSCLLMEEGNTADFKTLQSTVIYTSPELLSGGTPTDKSDVYSFGITLWQLIYREKPYNVDNKIDLQSTVYKIVKQKKRPQKKQKKNELLEKLYVKCWDHEPNNRPAMEDVVQYLENIHIS